MNVEKLRNASSIRELALMCSSINLLDPTYSTDKTLRDFLRGEKHLITSSQEVVLDLLQSRIFHVRTILLDVLPITKDVVERIVAEYVDTNL